MASPTTGIMSRTLISGLPAPVLLLLLLVVLFLGALQSGPAMADQVLYPGSSLFTGQSLNENNYVLTMQSDCNLVLYDGGGAVWASGTNRRGSSCRATMQRDGNLVVYDGNGAAVWSSDTARATGNYALVLQRDRNLVIYGPPKWDTGTNTGGVGGLKAGMTRTLVSGLPPVLGILAVLFLGALQSGPAMADQVLYPDTRLFTGESLRQGNYALTMRRDCNLVLTDDGKVVWDTRTSGSGYRCYLIMQTDGNLVVWTSEGRVAWASGTASVYEQSDYALVLQSDRNLVIYGPSIWASGTSTDAGDGGLKAAPGGAPAGEGGDN